MLLERFLMAKMTPEQTWLLLKKIYNTKDYLEKYFLWKEPDFSLVRQD